MALFAVSDIHSFYDQMITALKEKGFFQNNDNKLLLLGDALDRGDQTNELVDFLLKLKNEGRLIYIQGNHEDLLVRCLQKISSGGVNEIACGMSVHYRNGTFGSLLQMAGMSVRDAVKYPEELVRTVMRSPYYRELLPSCVDYYETDTHVFCHGWIPSHMQGLEPEAVYSYNSDWRNASLEEWNRARWFNGMKLACMHGVTEPGKTVVCGHFHTSWGHCRVQHSCTEWGADANFSPFYADGIIAIDACTYSSNKVNCLIFDN